MPRSGVPQPVADAESLNEDMRRMGLAEMPAGHSDTPSSNEAPHPTGSGSDPPMVGTRPPWIFLYGLNTAAQGYAFSVSTNMGTYEELPKHYLRFALDLVASTPASEYLDSTETPGPELRAIASRHHDSMDR
jgi:hypothetical protein